MPAKKSIKSYSQLSDELELIISKFEDENLEIDKAIELYEQADKIINEMQAYLEQAKNKITKLKT